MQNRKNVARSLESSNDHRWELFPRGTPRGKQKLLGISKRGNKYLRKLFVQGARSALQYREKQVPALSHWLAGLLGRAHQNVVIVALANKLVRTAWAVLQKNEIYRVPVAAVNS